MKTNSVSAQVVLPKGTKTYTTHARAKRHGGVVEPGMVELPDGSLKWVALPMFDRRCVPQVYVMEAA